jgi:tetratricopeptide (TPR) repeat protein
MSAADPVDATELYERGGEHDSAGREEQAIPLYQQALAAGLTGEVRARCLLQLGSSLRNVGRIDEAVALLQDARREFPEFRALRAFLALALHSAGRDREALRELLETIADEGEYERSLRAYAAEVTAVPGAGLGPGQGSS